MAKKVLFVLMPNYRDEEFTIPYDMLCKANLVVDVAGLKPGITIGSEGHQQRPNLLFPQLTEQDLATYSAIIIPGGPGSEQYLWNNEQLQKTIKYFHSTHKIIAAICHAVVVVAQTGILHNKHVTVFPSDKAKQIFNEYGVRFSKDGCVALSAEKIITAQGPNFAKEFGQAILSFLH